MAGHAHISLNYSRDMSYSQDLRSLSLIIELTARPFA